MLLTARDQSAAIEMNMPGNPSLDLAPPFDARALSRGKVGARLAMRLVVLLGDIAAIVLAFCFIPYLRFGDFASAEVLTVLAVTIPVYLVTATNGKAYDIDSILNARISVQRGIISFLLSISLVALLAFFLKAGADFSRLIFGFGTLTAIPGIVITRLLVIRATRHVIGDPFVDIVIRDGVPFLGNGGEIVIDAADYGLHPSARDPHNIQRLGSFMRNVDRVVVACPPERRAKWSFVLKALDIHAEIQVPELDELGAVGMAQINEEATLVVSTGPMKFRYRILKRAFDLALVLSVLPFLAIPMLLIALAIKMETPGPVLFRQVRIGLGNRPFHILKFRSMRMELCDMNGNRSAARDDDRITKVGAFIRKTSIDELPQILNVLLGDMSIVGPRPHAVGSRAENMLFWDIDDRYWHRHAIKPGLTGLAQIRGFRGATEVREDLSNRLQADLEYRANWSLLRDISIILATFKVLVHRNAF